MLWHQLLKLLVKGTKLTPETTAIDGTLVPSFAFADTTSYSGKHHKTGTKVSLAVDESGLPLAEQTACGSTHDISIAPQTVEKMPVAIRFPKSTRCWLTKAMTVASFGVFLRDKECHLIFLSVSYQWYTVRGYLWRTLQRGKTTKQMSNPLWLKGLMPGRSPSEG